TAINFGMFAQGVMSVGGDVDVRAGGSIHQVSVSLPTTWRIEENDDGDDVVVHYGGGNLHVSAGDDIVGGSYFVARGVGEIRAGRDVVPISTSGSTELALQDAQLDVVAGRNVTVGGVFNPSYLFANFDSTPYSAASSVTVVAAGGNAVFGADRTDPGALYAGGAVGAPA